METKIPYKKFVWELFWFYIEETNYYSFMNMTLKLRKDTENLKKVLTNCK